MDLESGNNNSERQIMTQEEIATAAGVLHIEQNAPREAWEAALKNVRSEDEFALPGKTAKYIESLPQSETHEGAEKGMWNEGDAQSLADFLNLRFQTAGSPTRVPEGSNTAAEAHTLREYMQMLADTEKRSAAEIVNDGSEGAKRAWEELERMNNR